MSDLIKSNDLGIDYHITDNIDFNKTFCLTSNFSNDDIFKRVSSLSCNLTEREFALASCRPFLPNSFKVRPHIDRIKQGQNALKLNNTLISNLPSQNTNDNATITSRNARGDVEKNDYSHIITQAEDLASQAHDLETLLNNIQDLQTGLECQKFACSTLSYHDGSNVDMLWIGESVSTDDDRNQKIYSDNAGQMIENCLQQVGFGRSKALHNGYIGFVNMSFWPLKTETNNDASHIAYQICLPFVKKIIDYTNPKKIILSGEAATFHLLGKDKNTAMMNMDITQDKTSYLNISNRDIHCLPTFSIDYILKSDVAKKLFWFDLLSFLHDTDKK